MERQSRKRKRGSQFVRNVKASLDGGAVVPDKVCTDNTDPVTDVVSSPTVEESAVPDSIHTQDEIPLVETEREPSTESPPCTTKKSVSSSPCRLRSRSIPKRSPSPARFYREREQSELQNLNDRLSSHVENMKQLQSENAIVKLQLAGMEVIHQEMQTMKQLHSHDIERLQELLDTARQENNSIEQNLESTKQEKENLREALTKKTEELDSLEQRLGDLQILSQQCERQQAELRAVKETLSEKEADVTRISEELVKVKVAKKRLEEDAQVNKTRYVKELEQASSRMNQHLENYDQKLEAGYEVMVSDALTNVREQHARDLAVLKEELTNVYQTKLIDWKTKAERGSADLLATKKELKASRSDQDALRSQTTRFKMDAAAFKVQIEEEQMKYQDLRNETEKERGQHLREMVLLRQELAEAREELEELGGANMRLEQEISAYRVILEDLESKSPFTSPVRRFQKHGIETGSPSTASVSPDANKVMAGQMSSTHEYLRTNEVTHGIHVDDVDPDGRYVSLVNRTDHLMDVCLWSVQQSVSRTKVRFEIPYSIQMECDQRLVIWSEGEGPFENKTSCDPVLSLSGHSHTTKDGNPHVLRIDADGCGSTSEEMRTSNYTLHISMQGRRWMKNPCSMNIRLEDGDGQLQTKCDLTSLQNGQLLDNVSLNETDLRSKAAKRLAMLLPFYNIDNDDNDDDDDYDSDRESRGMNWHCSSKRKRGPKRMRSMKASGDTKLLRKDGCLTM